MNENYYSVLDSIFFLLTAIKIYTNTFLQRGFAQNAIVQSCVALHWRRKQIEGRGGGLTIPQKY